MESHWNVHHSTAEIHQPIHQLTSIDNQIIMCTEISLLYIMSFHSSSRQVTEYVLYTDLSDWVTKWTVCPVYWTKRLNMSCRLIIRLEAAKFALVKKHVDGDLWHDKVSNLVADQTNQLTEPGFFGPLWPFLPRVDLIYNWCNKLFWIAWNTF